MFFTLNYGFIKYFKFHTVPADFTGQDYSTEAQSRTLGDGTTEVCAQFGALDDISTRVLEDIEFY